MRKTYVYDEAAGKFVEKQPDAVTPTRGPIIQRDLPGYHSPVTNEWIEGRAARREDLKRHGCREVDPSEIKQIRRHDD